MADKISFSAQTRTLLGKKTKKLRSEGLIPGNVMGHNIDSVPVSLIRKPFSKLYKQVGDTGLFYLNIDGETTARPVLIDDVDHNPMTGEIEHVVMKQVNLKEKISAEIPVELTGVFEVKDATLLTVLPTIEVEALPTDLPEKFEIDISLLTEIGQAVLLKDLKFDHSKIELKVSEEELDSPVVLVQEHKEEVIEEETPETPEGETPAAETAEGEAPAAEGEAPAATE